MLEAASPVVDNYVNQAYRTLDLRDNYVSHINNKQYTAKSCLSSVPKDFHLWLFPKSYRPDNSVGMDRHINIHWQLSHLHLDSTIPNNNEEIQCDITSSNSTWQFKQWKWEGSKCYWTNKQIEPFTIIPQYC